MNYGFYLVAFIDLLGQQDELKQLVKLPHTPESRDEVMGHVKAIGKKVRAVRLAFQDYLAQVATNRKSLSGLTPEQVREYNAMRTLTFHQIGFSDSFVISVPLMEGEYGAATAAIGVWSALYGIAGTFLTTLATEIPLRAGIDVERGIDLFPNEVYGPALLNAYQLECHDAQYPRALVGEGLLSYLDYLGNVPTTDKWSAVPHDLAPVCRRLITAAPDDGRPMLDMLAPDVLNVADMRNTADAAYRFATVQHQRHVTAKNEKLIGYYDRLLRYFHRAGFGQG